MFKRATLWLLAIDLLALALSPQLFAKNKNYIVLQSTTSVQNSGLLGHLIPIFHKKTGVGVRVVAVGTGQALKNARNGDGDVLLVHSRAAEKRFVSLGFGIERHEVMYNDYVVIGPRHDPANIRMIDDIAQVFLNISSKRVPFVSRGDNSGTHIRELSLWNIAGIAPDADGAAWYREAGSGMGATLNIAVGMGAYALTDRATWLSFQNKGDFEVLAQGDTRLSNPYSVILINPVRHPHVNGKGGRAFIKWLTSPEGQGAINAFRLNGEQLFYSVLKN